MTRVPLHARPVEVAERVVYGAGYITPQAMVLDVAARIGEGVVPVVRSDGCSLLQCHVTGFTARIPAREWMRS